MSALLAGTLLSTFLAACDVTTLTNSWARAQVYQGCSFGSAVLVSADSAAGLRSVLISQEGVLEVFDSFCAGPESQCVGARTFLLYPPPALSAPEVSESGIRIGDLQGHRSIVIAPGTVSPLRIEALEGLEDARITEFPLHAPAAGDLPWSAGMAISRAWDYLVDLGFRVGGPPEGVPAATARVVGPGGQACKDLKVADLFSNNAGVVSLKDQQTIRTELGSSCQNP
jgi:hypothetical protein